MMPRGRCKASCGVHCLYPDECALRLRWSLMAAARSWDPPSPRVAELIRTAASAILEAPDEVFTVIDEATLAPAEDPVAGDPALVAAIQRNNRALLVHWASANVASPGERVAPSLGADTLAIARDAVRRGFDQGVLQAYRVGQNVSWEAWMATAFELTSDPGELREFLQVSARSIFDFVDATVTGISEQIEREREQLTSGTHAQRLEAVSLILEGAPISSRRASTRLAYELDRPHTAAVVWADDPGLDPLVLEQAADALGRAADASPLTVLASVSALWVWVGSDRVDLAALEEDFDRLPGARVAVGPSAAGMAGFRRSHLDAIATQRLVFETSTPLRVATYEDVQVAALATENEERARQFVERTLGPFAQAPPELRETVRVYLREGSNIARAARALFAHRNTVLARLARAREMLAVPLDTHLLQVALALEIVHWTGPPRADGEVTAAGDRRRS